MPFIPGSQVVRSAGPVGPTGPTGPAGAGASISEYAVGTSSVAGATTLILDRVPTGVVNGGSFVAIGVTTTKCEVRRVTGISSATLTLSLALDYDHTAGDFVWVLDDTWVPAEWFGCKANDPTFDNATGLIQVSINAALTSNLFGLTGHGQRYYCSTPLAFYDGSLLENICFTVKSPLSIDPKIGLRNSLPDQFFVNTAGQFVTVSAVDTSANTITLSGQVGTAVGDRLMFYALQGATLPAPLEAGRAYYLLTNPSGFTYTISIDRAGTAVDFTTSGSGTTYCFSSGLTRIRWDGVSIEGNETQALNGLIAKLQQPARTIGLRVEAFPGPMGVFCLGGQQSDHFSTMLLDGTVGLMLQGGQFHYFHASNIEDCDYHCISDTIDQEGNSGFGRDVHFWGCHWESIGVHSARTQTITGNASVSAGTFTVTFGGQTTSGISYDASAATIQTALEALSTIDPGDVTVTQQGAGLLSAGGRMQIVFAGQFAWRTLSAPNLISVSSVGLTGGSYSWSYTVPDSCSISIRGPQVMIGVHGGVFTGSGIRPDGTGGNFLVMEATGSVDYGYVVENLISTGQTGNAIYDIPRGITVSWADTTGTAERLLYFGAGGRHAGTTNKNWYLAGRSGGYMAWNEFGEELLLNGSAKVRFGDTGPIVKTGAGTPEGVETAPIGSLFLRSDGGASTTLYVKQSGAGNTGWAAK